MKAFIWETPVRTEERAKDSVLLKMLSYIRGHCEISGLGLKYMSSDKPRRIIDGILRLALSCAYRGVTLARL